MVRAIGANELEAKRTNAASEAATQETGHPPRKRVYVIDIVTRATAVGSAHIFMMDEVLDPTQDVADTGDTPRHNWCPSPQAGDQCRETLGFLGSNPVGRRASEMVSQHQMGSQVRRGPSLAQRGSVGTKLEQQVTELPAFAGINRFGHMALMQVGDSSFPACCE